MPKQTIAFDVHRKVTDQIMAAIHAGTSQFQMPWHQHNGAGAIPTNATTKARYHGINIIALWASCMTHAFPLNIWASYKQWQQIGAQVRKGEAGTCIVFYKEYQVEPDTKCEIDDGVRRIARASWVFNASQVANQVDDFALPLAIEHAPIERITSVDNLIDRTGADIRHSGDQAYYHPKEDFIQMPDERLSCSDDETERSEDYYAVLFHELIHWTGSPKRLNRIVGKQFVDATYAKEELIAELGAAFLCAETGISNSPRPGHGQYIETWLKLLKNDKQAIFTASALASRAVQYIQECR